MHFKFNKSNLASGTIYHGSTVYAEEDYIYDHLGQRMLKIGETPTYFAYDIFGNFFAELDLDGDPWPYNQGRAAYSAHRRQCGFCASETEVN